MRLVLGGRQTGKTFELVRMVKDTPRAVLVVLDEHERTRMVRDFSLLASQVTTFERAMRHELGAASSRTVFVVDNADMVLAAMLHGKIAAVSMEPFDGPVTMLSPKEGLAPVNNVP